MSFDLAIKNGDLVLNNGDLATITGTDKLVQDILKIALTDAGANVFARWYGSLVSKSLIGSSLTTDIISSVAQNQLQVAITNLQKLQNLQVQSGQKVDPSEQIAFIQNIAVTRNAIDPRLFQVSISVLSRAFGKVQTSFTVNNT